MSIENLVFDVFFGSESNRHTYSASRRTIYLR